METGKEKRKEAVLNHIAYWEHQQAEKAKPPYFLDDEIELSYFDTPKQLETCLDLVEKYHNKIYLPLGKLINLKVVKYIANAAGLNDPLISRDPDGAIWINGEVTDSYGDAIGEIVTIYSFCCGLASFEMINENQNIQ